MLLSLLLIVPVIGAVIVSNLNYRWPPHAACFTRGSLHLTAASPSLPAAGGDFSAKKNKIYILREVKPKPVLNIIALLTSVVNLIISIIIFIMFNNSSDQFQYVERHSNIQLFEIYLGLDGISVYFMARRLINVKPAQLRVATGKTLCKPTDLP